MGTHTGGENTPTLAHRRLKHPTCTTERHLLWSNLRASGRFLQTTTPGNRPEPQQDGLEESAAVHLGHNERPPNFHRTH